MKDRFSRTGEDPGEGDRVEEVGDGGVVIRHEEQLEVGTRDVALGSVGVSKTVETERFDQVVPRDIEHADTERVAVAEGVADSGEIETLPDGSISVPVFEERVVVTKELVVRERIIVRKHTVSEQYRVEADLRTEHVEIDTTNA